MPVETLNPASLFEPEHYAQVSIATGTRIVSIAGQVAHGAHGHLVAPGDLEAQVEQAFVNVGLALAAASATFADVFKLTIYVVTHQRRRGDRSHRPTQPRRGGERWRQVGRSRMSAKHVRA